MDDPILWERAFEMLATEPALYGDERLRGRLEARGRHQHAKGLARYKDADGQPLPLRKSTQIDWLRYACEEAADCYIYLVGAALNCPAHHLAIRSLLLEARAIQLRHWAQMERLAMLQEAKGADEADE